MESQIAPDEEIVRLAQGGSMTAFEELVHRYESRVFRYLIQGCSSETDAADLAQETFVTAYQKLAQFNPHNRFSAWIFTIARRKQIDHWRARKPVTDSAVPDIADTDDPSVLLSRREERLSLWQIARKVLSDVQYQALWLKYVEEMSVEEIAAVLRRTVTHVKVILFRARAALASALDNDQKKTARHTSDTEALPADDSVRKQVNPKLRWT